jgi:GTPase Era involved in 16S rRNA processing
MVLQQPANELFAQLKELLLALTNQEYFQPITVLSGASIGQHTRHIIELFQELNNGYETGMVNYEERKRDFAIESNREIAIEKFDEIGATLSKKDKNLQLISEYSDSTPIAVATNYYRELVYNLEHTVHHMALIRVGVLTQTSIELPASFGVASSTIKHRKKQCAQ